MSEFTSNGADKKETWVSPRAKREIALLAIREVFEDNMSEADERLISREEAIEMTREFATVMYED